MSLDPVTVLGRGKGTQPLGVTLDPRPTVLIGDSLGAGRMRAGFEDGHEERRAESCVDPHLRSPSDRAR